MVQETASKVAAVSEIICQSLADALSSILQHDYLL